MHNTADCSSASAVKTHCAGNETARVCVWVSCLCVCGGLHDAEDKMPAKTQLSSFLSRSYRHSFTLWTTAAFHLNKFNFTRCILSLASDQTARLMTILSLFQIFLIRDSRLVFTDRSESVFKQAERSTDISV